MRLDDLAARLVIVETKLALLTGATFKTENAASINELDARLSIVEVQVDQLIVEKTQSHVDEIIALPINEVSVEVEDVIALSASANVPEAASIVEDVVLAQIEAPAVEHEEVATVIAAAVTAVITADPEVVTNPDAITAAITAAVSELSVPTEEVHEQTVDAVVQIIAAATGNDVSDEVKQQVSDAVTTPADPALDAIEARLEVAEAKVDSLLGK